MKQSNNPYRGLVTRITAAMCLALCVSQPGIAADLAAFMAADKTVYPMKDCNSSANDRGIPDAGWNLTWENDTAIPADQTDRNYTQGLQLAYRFRPDEQPGWLARPMGAVCRWLSGLSDPSHRRLLGAGSVFIGQHMFTPDDTDETDLIPDDRPYAAWLYVGSRLEFAQPYTGRFATTGLFHSFELQVGTLGPRAQGEWVQNNFHKLIGSDPVMGWDNQLPNEFGAQFHYKVRALLRKWPLGTVAETDIITSTELGLGTIQVFGGAGGTFRLGRNLGDPVVDQLTPTLAAVGSTTRDENGCANGRGIFAIKECYLFVGINGRATAFNAFLDGGMFNGGHSVDREPFTYEWMWGARLRWSRFQLDYTAVNRSREFSPDPVATASNHGRHKYGAVNARCFAPLDGEKGRTDLICPGFFTLLFGLIAAQ
jgi:lipid A 3-O-deacylase